MATMRTQHAGPVRMPFGEISGDRLQGLASMKNRQNALQVHANTKRKATDSVDIFCDNFNDQDSENIDPSAFFKSKSNLQSNKRSKTSFSTKTPLFETIVKPAISTSLPSKSTTSILSTTDLSQRKIAKPKSRLQKTPLSTTTTIKSSTKPETTGKMLNHRTRAPAGRSPIKPIIGRRGSLLNPAFKRTSMQSIAGMTKSRSDGSISLIRDTTRFEILRTRDVEMQIAEAVSIRRPSIPKHNPAWDFEIHEDTEDQERENLLSHHADQLDLSGDEDSTARFSSTSDKENVPPLDWEQDTTPARSQMQMIAEALNITQSFPTRHTESEVEQSDDETPAPAPAPAQERLITTPHHIRSLGEREMLLSPIPAGGGRLAAFSPTGKPAADFERSSPGGLPRSPGMMNLSDWARQEPVSPLKRKRAVLGELPVEDFHPAEAEEEVQEEEEEEETSWLKRDDAGGLPSIDEKGDDDEEMDSGLEKAEVQEKEAAVAAGVLVFPPRTSSLAHAETM